jgi:hypothetical protein
MPVVFSPGSWLDSDTLERERENVTAIIGRSGFYFIWKFGI